MVTKGKKIGIGLDRMVIGLPYPKLITSDGSNPTAEELNLHDAKKKQFQSQMKHIESVITSGPHHCKGKIKDQQRYLVLSNDDDTLLCVFTLGFCFGRGVINFEFNPSKLTPDNFSEISGLLMAMFFDHYDELFDESVVSHAEFFIDVSGEELSNLVLIDSGRRTPKQWKGTSYHGPRSSRLVTVMYNKAKQQKLVGSLFALRPDLIAAIFDSKTSWGKTCSIRSAQA